MRIVLIAVVIAVLTAGAPQSALAQQRSRCEPRTNRDYRTRYVRSGSEQIKVQLGPCVTEGLAVFVVSAFTRGAAIDNSPAGLKSPPPANGSFTITAAHPNDVAGAMKLSKPHQYVVWAYDHHDGADSFFIVVRGTTVEIVGHSSWVF